MRVKRALAWSVVLAGCALAGWGQQAPPPAANPNKPALPVTPLDPATLSEEERRQYEEFARDQAPADQTFEEWLAKMLEPVKVPAAHVVRNEDGTVNPSRVLLWKMELVREEGEFLWLRHLPPENPQSQLHRFWLRHEQEQLRKAQLADRRADEYFLPFDVDLVPPPSVDALSFRPVESELPPLGRWQMGVAVGDMNQDGHPDLVAPPERLGAGLPVVFLGDGKGGFRIWREATWTPSVPYDYGGVALADLDLDGDLDIVLAIHFKGQYVIYNDGGGRFARATLLPSPDPRVTSRAPAVADFDLDGRPDAAFLAEISYDQARGSYMPQATTLWVVLNRGEDRWEKVTAGLPAQVIGDDLGVADLDRDGRPDLLLGAGTTNWRSLAWLNPTSGWQEAYGPGVLSNAWHFELALDPASRPSTPDLYAVFEQFKMVGGVNRVRTGVVRYRWGADGLASRGEALVVDDQATNQYWRLAVGDLDGDGRSDVVAGRKGGGLEVFLQTPTGALQRERSPELEGHGRPFDIEILDLDGDSRQDIVATFVPKDELPGGIYVWLNRPGA